MYRINLMLQINKTSTFHIYNSTLNKSCHVQTFILCPIETLAILHIDKGDIILSIDLIVHIADTLQFQYI